MYQKIMHYYDEIVREINVLRKRLDAAPKDSFFVFHDGNRLRAGYYDSSGRHYFKQEDLHTIKPYVQKRYDSLRFKRLQKEARALKAYFKLHSEEDGATDFIAENPELSEMLFRDMSSDSYYAWADEPYESGAGHPEDLKYKAFDGKVLRSKSEVMIYEQLKTNKLAFRYESRLQIEGKSFYPDFLIKHPRTGKIIIWEHFGKMDDPEYRRMAMRKLQMYSEEGYILGVDLIITTETKDKPFSSMDAVTVIKDYFK
ncbi:MAG: hypothetical protein IKR26_05580 [Lachnospiraceae bacterium]|nr:hypothetical protein [Lachnospiraceae bacterium]